MIIAIDFDGTCVTHEYPKVGHEIGAATVLKKLVNAGHQLILYTMRSDGNGFKNADGTIDDHGLTDAVNWFKAHEIPLYGIQTNPTQSNWTSSPKCYAQLYIDDAALGCPLTQDYVEDENGTAVDFKGRPYVNWTVVEKMLTQIGIL